jgi:hypothetical protein
MESVSSAAYMNTSPAQSQFIANDPEKYIFKINPKQQVCISAYLNQHHAGIVMGARPCGTIIMLNELFGEESISQVYGQLYTFAQDNNDCRADLAFIFAKM